MGNAAANPMGIEWFGLAMGLGFVLSIGPVFTLIIATVAGIVLGKGGA